jgi:glycosyltransferase involved in cell wall biosynthesis
VVDDGSTDGSGDEARQIEGMRLIQFSPNRGTGAVRKAGTRAARGRVVVLTDVDMTCLLADLVVRVNKPRDEADPTSL